MANSPGPAPGSPGGSGPGPVAGRERQRQVRLAGIGALGVVGLVFVIQNGQATEIRLLWWSVRMPLVFVLVAMTALGVGLDRLWVWRRRRR